MIGWPIRTLATVPWGLPNAPLIPVWSLQTINLPNVTILSCNFNNVRSQQPFNTAIDLIQLVQINTLQCYWIIKTF